MGSYPVPIKTPEALKADVHPIIFQCYKAFWVFLTGWLFVLANLIRGKKLIFEFTWWGTISAAAWIPSGLATIAAVPRLGVGMTVVVATGTASTLSFLVFWLVLGSPMKEYGAPGHHYYLAPIYMMCVVLGMAGLVGSQHFCRTRTCLPKSPDAISELHDNTSSQTYGLLCGCLAGVFSAVQYGAVTFGKGMVESRVGCKGHPQTCPPEVKEQFNNFGSWMASFGIGSGLVTLIFLGALAISEKVKGKPFPDIHFKTLRGPGSLAGLLWVLGNLFQTAAVVRGGNAVMVASNQVIALITSGAWGLLYYHEVHEPRRVCLWVAAALWTTGAVVLLTQEKLN